MVSSYQHLGKSYIPISRRIFNVAPDLLLISRVFIIQPDANTYALKIVSFNIFVKGFVQFDSLSDLQAFLDANDLVEE